MVSAEGTSKYLSEIDLQNKKTEKKKKEVEATETQTQGISIVGNPHNDYSIRSRPDQAFCIK